MSIFKKISEQPAHETISMLIYGTQGVGKTTLAISAPSPVILDFEDGLHRVNEHFAKDVPCLHPKTWGDVEEAIKELRNSPEIKTVVVDSVDRLLDAIMDHIKRTKSGAVSADGIPTKNTYMLRKNYYTNFMKDLRGMGKNVVFLAHEIERTEKVNGIEVAVKRPNVTDSNMNELTTDLDLIGRMFYVNGVRYITFDAYGDIISKNTINLHGKFDEQSKTYLPMAIKVIEDGEGCKIAENDFVAGLIGWKNAQKARRVAEAIEAGKSKAKAKKSEEEAK